MTAGPGALDGIRVLDLSRFIAGPLCAQLLGDMGAEVIKVERPGGEDAREQGSRYRGESLYSMAFNRNKLGVTLNTRHPAAADILERLIRASDVLVENYRPGTLASMGLEPRHLRELNPGLVVTSLSGFGQTGPLSSRALFDPIAQAMSGLMSLTGDPDGPPALTGTYIADHLAGLYGAIGTLLALIARDTPAWASGSTSRPSTPCSRCLGTRALEVAMLVLGPERHGSRDAFSSPATFPGCGRVPVHPRRDRPVVPEAVRRHRPGGPRGGSTVRDVAGRRSARRARGRGLRLGRGPDGRRGIEALAAAGIPVGRWPGSPRPWPRRSCRARDVRRGRAPDAGPVS